MPVSQSVCAESPSPSSEWGDRFTNQLSVISRLAPHAGESLRALRLASGSEHPKSVCRSPTFAEGSTCLLRWHRLQDLPSTMALVSRKSAVYSRCLAERRRRCLGFGARRQAAVWWRTWGFSWVAARGRGEGVGKGSELEQCKQRDHEAGEREQCTSPEAKHPLGQIGPLPGHFSSQVRKPLLDLRP